MKPEIKQTTDGSVTLFIEDFDEHYHSIHGAVQESKHVYIQAGLDFISKEKKSIAILEMGFGTGLNAILSFLFAKKKGINLDYHTIEKFPIDKEIYQALQQEQHYNNDDFLIIHEAKNNIQIQISQNITFTKYIIDILDFSTDKKFDIIYYDAFAPSAQEELWTTTIFEKMYTLLKNNGILVTYCAKGYVKRNLKSVGFLVESLPGPIGKREMTKATKLKI